MNLTHTLFVKILRRAALAPALLLALLPARAADEAAPALAPLDPPPADQFVFRLGAFLVTNIDTRLSLTTDSGGGGTLIDFGDTLGGETSANIFRVDADWNIGPHLVQGAWYDISLNGHRVIDREIHWGDEIYPINAEIDSRLRTSIYKLSYGYTFHKGQRHEFTGLIGAHVMRLSTSLTISNVGTAEGFDVTAPLPAFGVGWTAHWTDRFQTRVVAQYFGISIDDRISGHFLDLLFAAEYRLSRHWSVGGGYNRFDLDIEATRGPLTLHIEDSYNGFLAYVGFHF